MSIRKQFLLVEGSDDRHVLNAILRAYSLHDEINVVDHGGKPNLLDSLPVRLKESDVSALGVVLDADEDVSASWASVRGRLVTAGYESVPSTPDAAGTILEPPEASLLPRAGIWIMPNNEISGTLEHFLSFLVPADDLLMPHAMRIVDEIGVHTHLFAEVDKPKATIHTWLAWQRAPGKPFGTAITARFLDTSMPAAEVLATWLTRLFTAPP